jgi:hypothetical protein
MTRRSRIFVTLCGSAVGMLPALAPAQVIEPMLPGEPIALGNTVTDRARPGLDPEGVSVGDFTFLPRAEIDGSYNDNIFATQNGKVGSWLTTLLPSFDLQSNLPQNAIDVSAGAAIGRQSNHDSEDFNDGFGAVSGRLDIDALHQIIAGVRFDRLHESRASPDSPANAAEPVRYTVYSGNLGFAQTGTRIGYEVNGVVTRSEFEAPLATGGGFVPQDDRNVTGFEGALRVFYEFQPGYQAYLRGAGNTQQFDHAAGNGIPSRDSNGYRVDGGMRIDLADLTYAEFYGGYIEQDFNAAQFSALRGVDYGARLVWNFTAVDTMNLAVTRTINNANAEAPGVATSPGYLATIENFSVDHELLRDLLLNANLGYEVDFWRGISRTDHIVDFGFGAKYLVNRYLYLGASYTFQQRFGSSTQSANVPYNQNIVQLRLSSQL